MVRSVVVTGAVAALMGIGSAAWSSGQPADEAGNDAMMNVFQGSEMRSVPATDWVAQGGWFWVGVDPTGASWYLEQDRSDFAARPIRVLIRVDHREDRSATYLWTEREGEIDCARRRYRILRTRHEDPAGRASTSDETGGGRFDPVRPGSIFQQVADTACYRAMEIGRTPLENKMMGNLM